MATTSGQSPQKIKSNEDKTSIEINLETRKVGKCNPVHGWTYQLKILILIYVRSVACCYDFKLNTENEEEFGKFDDAIFEYIQNGETFIRLVQIKHVKNETLKIQKDDLRPKDKKDNSRLGNKFILSTYFESFLKHKKEVANLILYTNLSFGYDVLTDLFVEIQKKDDIFDVFLPDYKNNATTSLPWGYNERDICKIPKKHKLVYDRLEADKELYKQFINLIKKYKSPKNLNEKFCEKCSEKFNDKCSEKCCEKFCKKVCKNFCDKFIFATGQPNDNEMNFVLENEIPRISTLPMLGLVYAEYMNIFLCWLDNKYENTDPLTSDDMKHIVSLIKLKSENLVTSTDYHKKFKDLKYELDQTIIKVKNYFKKENSKKNFLKIYTKFPQLTLAKILQCFEYDEKSYKGECLILEVRLNKIEESVNLIEYFQFCVIIFHVEVAKDYKKKVFKMLENNKRKVVILNTRVNCEPDETEDDCCFKHLQSESKNNILKRKVCFDGDEVALKKFGSNELFDNIQDNFWFSKLIDDNLVIKTTNLSSADDNYIERYLSFLPNDPVIFTNYGKDNEIHRICDFSENSMINHFQRLIILKSEAGMGKTTLISSICKKYKNLDKNFWIEIIKLTKHVTVLTSYKTNEDVITFATTKIFNYDLFTAQLFKHQIEEMKTVVIMFDGFDEIDQSSKKAVLIIIEKLLETKAHQIWVTTRPISVKILLDHFPQYPIELKKFTNSNVIQCISHYWSKKGIQYEEKNLTKFAKSLLKYYYLDFRVPLYTKMAADFFNPDNLINNENSLENRIKLYDNCIRKKYMNLLDSKLGHTNDGHEANSSNQNVIIKNYTNWHKKLAMQMLCPQYGFKHDLDLDEIQIINSIGIATINVDDCAGDIIRFDHRTFAEYFMAKFIFESLTGRTNADDKLFEVLIFFEKNNEFGEVFNFLDEFLEMFPTTSKINLTKSENIIKDYKEILIKFFERHTYSMSTFMLKIALDNVDVIKYDLYKLPFMNYVMNNTSKYLIKNYLNELEKQITKQEFKEFLIMFFTKIGPFDEYGVIEMLSMFLRSDKLDYPTDFFFFKLFEEKFPEIYQILIGNNCNNNESEFIKFFDLIIKTRFLKIFQFVLYSLIQSIKNEWSDETKQYILRYLIEYGKNQHLHGLKSFLNVKLLKNPQQKIFYLKNLTKVFQLKDKVIMRHFEIKNTVLTYDELEMLLTVNVHTIPEKLKNIIKILGTFLLSYRYFVFDGSMDNIKPYFEKLLKYNNEELMVICNLVQIKSDYLNLQLFIEHVYNKEGRLYFTKSLNNYLPESVINCFCDNSFLFSMCFDQFLYMIQPI